MTMTVAIIMIFFILTAIKFNGVLAFAPPSSTVITPMMVARRPKCATTTTTANLSRYDYDYGRYSQNGFTRQSSNWDNNDNNEYDEYDEYDEYTDNQDGYPWLEDQTTMSGKNYNPQQPPPPLPPQSQPPSRQRRDPSSPSSSFDSAERPFQRTNDSYWSSSKYSSPNFSRRDLWNNEQQRDYRRNKFKRDAQWPQRQTYGGGQEKRYYGEQESYYYGDSGDTASRSRLDGRLGGGGSGGSVGGRRGGDGSQQYTEDFRQKSSSSSSFPYSREFGKEIGVRRQQQQQPSSFDKSWQTGPEQQIDEYESQPQPSLRQGSNIGEQYTENFRRGSFGADRYNYSRSDLANKGQARNRRQEQPPQQNYGDYGQNSSFDDDDQFQSYDDDQFQSYDNDLQQPPVVGRKQQQKRSNNNGGYNTNPQGGRGIYSNKPPRSPPPPPPPPPIQQFENENDYGWKGEQRQQYRAAGNSPDRRQPARSSKPDLDERGRQENNMFDRIAKPQYESDERKTRQYAQYESNQIPIERPMPPQYGSPPQYPTERSNIGAMRDDPFSMGFGYGGIKRIVNQFMNPFDTFGAVDQMMERVNNEMKRSMSQEQKSTKALLADARDCLLADPAVRTKIGTSITLGKPFSQSSSKSMVNGVTKSRLQLIIPISGSDGTGRLRLLANQDEIVLLEVDVGGRVFGVPLDGRTRRSENVIDADVMDEEIY